MLRRTFLKLMAVASNSSLVQTFSGFSLSHTASSTLRVRDLRCEYRNSSLGIDSASPRLSWQLDASRTTRRGSRQTGYQVVVASTPLLLQHSRGDLWDSGVVPGSQSVQVSYAGKELRSEQTCYWKVRVRDEQDHWSDWSAAAQWTMGLLHASDWHGSWIGAFTSASSQRAPDPWLRKRLSLQELNADDRVVGPHSSGYPIQVEHVGQRHAFEVGCKNPARQHPLMRNQLDLQRLRTRAPGI